MKGNLKRFTALVNKGEGCSYNMNIGEMNPQSGYMVSLPLREEKIPMEDGKDYTEEITNYVKKHSAELSEDENYLGAFHHKGTLYLDVSINLPILEDALNTAWEYKQKSIYDCANQDTITLNHPKFL